MDPETPEKATSAWTDEAKVCGTLYLDGSSGLACWQHYLNSANGLTPSQFQFLLRVVAQLKEDGRSIKWEKINLPGRTPKSLMHMWAKINKQITEFETAESNGEPTPVKTPRKRGPRE